MTIVVSGLSRTCRARVALVVIVVAVRECVWSWTRANPTTRLARKPAGMVNVETLRQANCGNGQEQAALEQEAVELTKIFTASQKTARRNELQRARSARKRR